MTTIKIPRKEIKAAYDLMKGKRGTLKGALTAFYLYVLELNKRLYYTRSGSMSGTGRKRFKWKKISTTTILLRPKGSRKKIGSWPAADAAAKAAQPMRDTGALANSLTGKGRFASRTFQNNKVVYGSNLDYDFDILGKGGNVKFEMDKNKYKRLKSSTTKKFLNARMSAGSKRIFGRLKTKAVIRSTLEKHGAASRLFGMAANSKQGKRYKVPARKVAIDSMNDLYRSEKLKLEKLMTMAINQKLKQMGVAA